MSEQRDDVTPEECKQRYEEYKADYTQRLTHSFIDVHRREVSEVRMENNCMHNVPDDFSCMLRCQLNRAAPRVAVYLTLTLTRLLVLLVINRPRGVVWCLSHHG